jgi:pimeloyl-ACP methyl ester carboxylesterase
VLFSHYEENVNGISLHYVKGGKGQPVLLLHGYPQTWYEWRKVMPALSKKYMVIAIDLRGSEILQNPIQDMILKQWRLIFMN